MGGGQSTLFHDRFGTSFESRQWLSLYLHGLLGPILLYAFHTLALYTVSTLILVPHSTTLQTMIYVGYVVMTVLAVWSLIQAQWADPGAVPLGARPLGVSVSRTTQLQESPTPSGRNPNHCVKVRSSETKETQQGDETNMGKKSRIQSLFVPQGNGLPRNRNDEDVMGIFLGTTRKNVVASRRASTRGIATCPYCGNNYQPPKARHDFITGRCIVKFHHYSVWIGNAVGIRNHKFFVLVHVYTCLSSFLSVVLLFLHFVQCSANTAAFLEEEKEEEASHYESEDPFLSAKEPQTSKCFDSFPILWIVFFAILSVIVNLYTCYIFLQQWDRIESNQSKIAKVHAAMGKRDGGRNQNDGHTVNELFGGIHPYPTWHWLLPTPIWFRSQRKLESVMGYEFRPEWLGEVYNAEHHDQDLELGVGSEDEEDGKRMESGDIFH